VARETEDQGAVLNQAIDQLRVLPPVDARAVSRIVKAAVEARDLGLDTTVAPYLSPPRSRVALVSAMLGVAAAAGIAGFIVRGSVQSSDPFQQAINNAAPAGAGATVPVTGIAADVRAIPTQFVLKRPDARDVRVIGDFNQWGMQQDAPSAKLTRGADGVWTINLPILPGRHTYAFVVDGVTMLDPAAPTAVDPDFGGKRSVIIVGKPSCACP
jgi:hypothetical protein